MDNIKKMLLKSSIDLHALMNKLIQHFCVIINQIFAIIKAKLLFYLHVLHTSIVVDYVYLLFDLESLKEMLSELQSEVRKYIIISQSVNQLLTTLNELIKGNIEFKEHINKIINEKKRIKKIYRIFSYKNDEISKIVEGLSTIKLLRSIELSPDKDGRLVMNLKMTLENLQKESSDIINLNIEKSLILKFNKSSESIKKLLDMIDMVDQEVSKEIISTIKQLFIVEIINLGKLYISINQIQNLYWKILIREYLLVCTIEFYNDVTRNVSEMFGSLKFDCSKPSEFLGKCSEVEKYISNLSKSINKCITNLSQSCKRCEGCILRKEPIELFIKLIWIILFLKFYVDLIAREILIFKMIILNLIVMCNSSAFIDSLMFYIASIDSIDSAIKALIDSYFYLETFYFIQLENTMTIFGLSELLLFSESIHQQYRVLLLNLYWINWLIWVIECYIQHLFVFRYVTTFLNSQITNVGSLGDIINQIKNVGMSMFKITDKLVSIYNSINQLKTVSDDATITNWKESAQKIRDQIKSVNRDIGEIDSQIDLISENVKSIWESWATLISLKNFLRVLIYYVKEEIKKTKAKILGTGIENRYYRGLIVSVMEPCNKGLKFILAYLVDMWVIMGNLIKIVQTTILMIYVKMGFLYGLNTKLKDDVDNIDKGVVDVECAIEGVARNLIQCSLQSLSNHIIKIQDINQNIDIIHINIKIYDLNNNLINNDKHYMCN